MARQVEGIRELPVNPRDLNLTRYMAGLSPAERQALLAKADEVRLPVYGPITPGKITHHRCFVEAIRVECRDEGIFSDELPDPRQLLS